ncbi:MAG: phosphoribosylanthranilate isomerase [Phycisphaerales bacterium]|nr:phosphoribosylanthranilate isomerase [Phycisphaerales bacterium]
MRTRTRVVVYGVTSPEEADTCARAGVDGIGLFFNPASKRHVEPATAWDIASLLPPLVSTIGVFENPRSEYFFEVEERCPTDFSQFHGNEDEDMVRQCGPRLIKTVRVESGGQADAHAFAFKWADVDEVDAVLMTLGSGIAGPQAWAWLAELRESLARPLLIGGGLTIDNVAEAVRTVRPWAVAVLGAVSPEGVTSGELLNAFVAGVAAGDRHAGR